ncbi:AP-1-like protein [Purpureocillium lavendulum]|uniref:AP-1-like protein n=1 Tax=Purpureocillium lavendulum TaxID=1247861 RepID=A0AB34FSS9_9HYPO|nr:AP-1-like protein [Purpureocillium lavendulum]
MLAALVIVVTACAFDASANGRAPITPDRESAAANAFHILNAVHSAGRQWGAALNHNGFGFFPAVMPKGTLLYHGAPSWQDDDDDDDDDDEEEESHKTRALRRNRNRRGYFHTYRANRDLKLLYIDGMAAAKSRFGPLDSQDLVLRENKTGPFDDYMDEPGRARDICRFVADVGMDGFVRVEIGFEVVYCDFFDSGLDLLTVTRSFMPHDTMTKVERILLYQMARAASREYDGLGAGRLRLDFSSMVSGFFFPINVSSTNPARPDLVRLGAASLDELVDVKRHLRQVCLQPRRFTVDWQGIVDALINRYADRLAALASDKLSAEFFIGELERATLVHVDAPALPGDLQDRNRTAEAVDRCAQHHLLPALAHKASWSLADELVYVAVEAVTHDVCQTLFESLSALQRSRAIGSVASRNDAIDRSRRAFARLMDRLAWTEWKKPRRCPVDQVSFVAMYPFGNDKDHWNPGCRSVEDLVGFNRHGYWDEDFLPAPGNDTDEELTEL